MKRLAMLMAVLALLAAGCQTSYSWRSSVPEELRTVSVSVFRNGSDVTELGAVVTRQVLREFQREGTFRIAAAGEGALEIVGELAKANSAVTAYERRTGARTREHRFTATAVVSVLDRRNGKVLVNDRKYTATTTFLVNDDILTGERDASGRLAEDLARQIVDDVLMLWELEKEPSIAGGSNAGKEA